MNIGQEMKDLRLKTTKDRQTYEIKEKLDFPYH